MATDKVQKRLKRKAHIKKTFINTDRPRLTVFRSNGHIYAQIIDDSNHKTVVGSSDLKIKKGKKVEKAIEVGKEISKLAIGLGVTKVLFDRNGYRYHGRVKALADAAREGGLQF